MYSGALDNSNHNENSVKYEQKIPNDEKERKKIKIQNYIHSSECWFPSDQNEQNLFIFTRFLLLLLFFSFSVWFFA